MAKLSKEAREWWIRKAEALFELERSLTLEDGGIVSTLEPEGGNTEVCEMTPQAILDKMERRAPRIYNSAQGRVHDLRQDLAGRWPHPTVMDSYVFLVTEVGEVGDALIRQGYGERSAYVRNTPGKSANLKKELGDVYLMLCTLANHLGISLDEALGEVAVRLRRKCRLSHEEIDAVIKRLKEEREYGIPKSK